VYSISLHRFIETREWSTHIDLEADKEVAYAATQVEAYVVQVNDAILTKHIRALQREIAIVSDGRSRPVVEQAAKNMGLHFRLANERVGTLLRPLLSDVPLDNKSRGLGRISTDLRLSFSGA
jgi:hypothetical protein